jgi:hypothetical protein
VLSRPIITIPYFKKKMHQQTLTWLFMIQDIWSCISTKTPLKNIYNYRHKLELVLEKQSHLRVDQSVPADKEHRDPIGGGRPCLIPWAVIEPFAIAIHDSFDSNEAALTFESHGDSISLCHYPVSDGFVHAKLPVSTLIPYLSISKMRIVAKIHSIKLGSRIDKSELPVCLEHHNCLACNLYTSVFRVNKIAQVKEKERQQCLRNSRKCTDTMQKDSLAYTIPEVQASHSFPPKPLDLKLGHQIISGFFKDSSLGCLEKSGCAVCGQLTPRTALSNLKSIANQLYVLESEGGARKERKKASEEIGNLAGPIIDHTCDQICESCRKNIRLGKVPRCALANGLWIGGVPEELCSFRYIEKLLIQKVQVNGCFVCVASSGMRKMVAHAIAFEAPVAKVYKILPPPVTDLDEVLAILFTGPTKPMSGDFQRTPLLVRRIVVAHALEWLKLNHIDSADLTIAYDELAKYYESLCLHNTRSYAHESKKNSA